MYGCGASVMVFGKKLKHVFINIYQEAIVVVLDVNHTMQKNLGEGDQSRFEVALDSIKMLIEQNQQIIK
jgi:hypothetical protein